MYLPVCERCRHGAVKNNKSHCQRESVYSYLTNCIQRRALDEYLERHATADTTTELAV
ncbi:MAG: hypothetical protein R6W66_06690 [Pelovirga sp.]